MLLILLTGIFVAGGQTISHYDLVQEEWEAFKATYNKHYENKTEEDFRMKIFMDNAYRVAEHNKRHAQDLVGFEYGINQFSDMSDEEFRQSMSCYIPKEKKNKEDTITFIPPANVEYPKRIDWRKRGGVTPVKNQTSKCHCCYSFSATGSLEGQHFRKTKKLVSLSEQNIVDCSQKFGNNGCHGGHVESAFNYIKANKGIDTEKSYPYMAEEGYCHYNPKHKGATIRGVSTIKKGDEEHLKAAVASTGPVSVSIDSSRSSFKNFAGKKVYYDPECSSENLDHSVVVVGYGTTADGEDYWIVKNSWGINWGDGGYIKMARNRNNHCGIATNAMFPVV